VHAHLRRRVPRSFRSAGKIVRLARVAFPFGSHNEGNCGQTTEKHKRPVKGATERNFLCVNWSSEPPYEKLGKIARGPNHAYIGCINGIEGKIQ